MRNITRRRFLQYGVDAGTALALPWSARAAKSGGLAKYIQPLPLPGAGIVVAAPSELNSYAFTQRQISRQLHPDLPPTPFWAYDDGSGLAGQAGSFGMALVAQSGIPLDRMRVIPAAGIVDEVVAEHGAPRRDFSVRRMTYWVRRQATGPDVLRERTGASGGKLRHNHPDDRY